jgi:isocitrate dehydrogenase
MKTKITVASGDGIGPEIMDVALAAFGRIEVPLEFEHVPMGAAVARSGNVTGISIEAKNSVESTGILFKGPMETPKGEGYKSVNVTARKLWGTFANKRVYRVLPGVPNPLGLESLDLTMVRENIEDTYGAVEHMQTHDVAQCRRFITRPGSLQVHRYAFEMAARKGAKRITCAHKANIMKLTDGLFLDTFYEVAREYPQLEADDVIVDALAMKLVLDPRAFDVVVLPNFQGDILTDLAAGLVGGLAYAPSANIGDGVCIFEAVHGTAPDIAGQDLANPTALLLSGGMLLRHLGLNAHAEALETALERTLIELHGPGQAKEPIHTSRFKEILLSELAPPASPQLPEKRQHLVRDEPRMLVNPAPDSTELRGVDVFLESGLSPAAVADRLQAIAPQLRLTMLSNRGTQVWPTGSNFTDCVNHYRARFENATPADQATIVATIGAVAEHFALCGAEVLREIDGEPGFSLAQGQA